MIKYFDMFAGVGGFRAGFDRAGGFECVGHCEIDKHADASYRAIHNIKESEVYFSDAREINPKEFPDIDLLCGGFPCQSFSQAGKRLGFEDARGTLFFELARLAKSKRPPYLLFENVFGLLSHDGGRTFNTILATLHDMGYGVEWQVLNSKHFGVPQSRRRVYIVGTLNPRCAGKILPVQGTNGETLVQIAGGSQGSRIYDSEGVSCTLTSQSGGGGGKTGLYFVDMCKGHPQITENARCITTRQNNGITNRKGQASGVLRTKETACAVLTPTRENVRQQGRRIKKPEEPMFTILASETPGVLLIKEATKRGFKEAEVGDSVDLGFAGSNTRRGRVGKDIAHTVDTGSATQGVVVRTGRIRRLMPKECFRLQGFTDEQADKILAITSDAQAYKQAGNAVTVNVVHAIACKIADVDRQIKAGEL